MAIDDSTDVTSNTLEDIMRKSKEEMIIAGTVKEHLDTWMDVLCINCDSSFMIIQLNDDNTKLKIICAECQSEIEIEIKKLSEKYFEK